MSETWPITVPEGRLADPSKKRVLYGEGDDLGLYPLQHPWAMQAYDDMNANFWRPNEVPMGPDIACWKDPRGLMDEERRGFWLTFGRLTTMDLLRVDSIAMLSRCTSSPEVSMALDTMAFQERMHSESYEVCVDHLGFDHQQIYGLYRHIKSIYTMVDYARQIDDNMMAAHRAYEAGDIQMGALAEEAIISNAFWFLMFEGIWFVSNLSGLVMSMAKRGKMPGTAEQFWFIRRDEDRHVALGVDLIRTLIKENPQAWNRRISDRLQEMFAEILNMEEAFINEALPTPILGYSAEGHMQYVGELANRRARLMDLRDPAPGAKNPYSWIDEMAAKKEKNFFETRVGEYQVGQLKWD